jgi:hypothetical protein
MIEMRLEQKDSVWHYRTQKKVLKRMRGLRKLANPTDEAIQARGVASRLFLIESCAMRRADRPDPSLRNDSLLRMTTCPQLFSNSAAYSAPSGVSSCLK